MPIFDNYLFTKPFQFYFVSLSHFWDSWQLRVWRRKTTARIMIIEKLLDGDLLHEQFWASGENDLHIERPVSVYTPKTNAVKAPSVFYEFGSRQLFLVI